MSLKACLYAFWCALVLSTATFYACNKTTSSGDGQADPNNIPAEQTVTASLMGRVLDESGVPVQGATVSSGGVTRTTDANGVFSFSSIKMSSRFGFVKVSYPGYFTGSRSVITNGGAANYVNIQLIPKVQKGTFAAATGGAVKVQDGDTASFAAASVVNAATGAVYTGDVKVYATYLDPTGSNLYKIMPGDLRGIGKNGKETALRTFGMLAVELEGSAGEKLQIASGKKATLTAAIPAALQGSAPETIPMWYFNDSTGRWIEEGTAIRIGNSYVGQVAHFSFWNYDSPVGTVNFKAKVKDQHGNPVAYTYIQLKSDVYGAAGGYTDSSGFVQGMIPKGGTFTLGVLTECGSLIGGANVGPALSDQDLGTITVNLSKTDLEITGTVVNCSQQGIDTGAVLIKIDGLNYRAAVSKGVFTMPLVRCYSSSASLQLVATDFATLQQSSPVSVSVTQGQVDVGQIAICGISVSEYIQFKLGQTNYSIVNPPDQFGYPVIALKPNYVMFVGNSANTDSISSFHVPSALFAFSNLTGLTGTVLDSVAFFVPSGYYHGFSSTVNTTITEYGPVQGWIGGSFNGTVSIPGAGSQVPVTGSFRVRRIK
ncbi:MAG: carboxypeptidase regulatory-like domain-containing protein [Bacteroidetes bacterium]|nr:carboxypeptidase regulatory-like domain-containing protein [Bacteroidota bacterium]